MMKLEIGRESGAENPRLAISIDGMTTYYGQPGGVPKSVSRKHCRVMIKDDLTFDIEDITDNNFMYVNGLDCKRRSALQLIDKIELGPDHYHLDLESILKPLLSKRDWHISHLQKVHDDYNQNRLDIQIKQGRLGALSALPGVLSMASIGLAFVIPQARVAMIIAAAVLAIAFVIIRIQSASNTPLKVKALDDQFREQYVCPNPACGRFLGNTPYKELLKNKSCPYCKSRFVA